MSQTYLLLFAAWVMFGCMATLAITARRRSKRIDRMMSNDGQSS